MRIKKNLKYQTFKRKQESFHNVQIIAMFFFFLNDNYEHCCSPVSEPVWSAKDTLPLAIFFAGEFSANLIHVLDLDTRRLLHFIQNCLLWSSCWKAPCGTELCHP